MALCVAAGALWAHYMLLLLTIDRPGQAGALAFAMWFAGVAGGLEALHQGGRAAVSLAQRLCAALPGRTTTGRRRRLWAPWPPWHRWVTLLAVAAGLSIMTPVGYIAIDHNPMGVYSEDPGNLLTLCVACFLWVFVPVELSHQACRLSIWCVRQCRRSGRVA